MRVIGKTPGAFQIVNRGRDGDVRLVLGAGIT